MMLTGQCCRAANFPGNVQACFTHGGSPKLELHVASSDSREISKVLPWF